MLQVLAPLLRSVLSGLAHYNQFMEADSFLLPTRFVGMSLRSTGYNECLSCHKYCSEFNTLLSKTQSSVPSPEIQNHNQRGCCCWMKVWWLRSCLYQSQLANYPLTPDISWWIANIFVMASGPSWHTLIPSSRNNTVTQTWPADDDPDIRLLTSGDNTLTSCSSSHHPEYSNNFDKKESE